MAKTKISEFSTTAADNTDITNINIAEGCSPANLNNAVRSLMALLKDQQTGSSGDPFTVAGTLVSSGQVDITGAFRLDGTAGASGQALVSAGGANTPTWSTLGTMASQSASAVAITGGTITGITDLTVADGGTGASTITANSVILGNGTSTLSGNLVAPSTSGNVLVSNGTTWNSSALSSLSAFDKSLSANGYQKLPSGLIMQWGESASANSDSSVSVTFPIVFPSACVSVVITGNKSMVTTGQGIQTVQSVSTTGFQINNGQDTAMTFFWLAMGY
jgi:hypothetical protein